MVCVVQKVFSCDLRIFAQLLFKSQIYFSRITKITRHYSSHIEKKDQEIHLIFSHRISQSLRLELAAQRLVHQLLQIILAVNVTSLRRNLSNGGKRAINARLIRLQDRRVLVELRAHVLHHGSDGHGTGAAFGVVGAHHSLCKREAL